ncbi:hypothetical protein AAIH15_32380, partial [Pseudomonas aeruginosa]
GVKPGGNIALLACAGPMGIGAIDYAINGGIQPARVVVVDIDDKRLAQVQKLLPVELAASKGIELVYMNTKGMSDPVQTLRALTMMPDLMTYLSMQWCLQSSRWLMNYWLKMAA